MRKVTFAALATVLVTVPLVAQTPAMKPGPEHARIAYFAGQWTHQGEVKESPLGPGGKTTGSETCDWFAGKFQLVCRGKGTGPKGPSTGMSVISYDASRKMYTFYALSSLGDNIFVRGTVDGKVWTWADEAQMEGKPVKIRATVTEDSPTSYSFKLEVGMGEGPMMLVEQGTSTKTK
jgi:hypothetical protein